MNLPMPAEPEVTVLITAFQTPAAYLREAMASALAQDVPGLEVLVIDDGSNPPLQELVAALGDERILYHRMEHRGLPHALIEGLQRARGRYVAILDHDDRLTPDSLSVRLRAMRESNVGLVYGDLQLMTPEGVVYGEQHFPELATPRAFVQACLTHAIGPLKHGTVLLDRAVALAAGNYNPALTVEYDLDLILRVALAKGHRHLPVPVIQYRVHPGNFSRTLRYRLQQIRFRWMVMDQHMPAGWPRRAAKIWVGVTNLGKAALQMLTHRRPARSRRAFRTPGA
jgi:glycosyltransferase involved in cell wall biosynthesis